MHTATEPKKNGLEVLMKHLEYPMAKELLKSNASTAGKERTPRSSPSTRPQAFNASEALV